MYLSEQPLWATQGFRGVLRITHLHACQRDHHAMLCAQLQDASIAIVGLGVVVASCQFSCMAAGVVPPVHPCYLQAHLHCIAGWLPM